LQAVAVLLTITSGGTATAVSDPSNPPPSARSSLVQSQVTVETPAAGQLEGEITFEAALAAALENNPELLAVRQELTVAHGRLTKARYWNPFNPHIAGGVGERRFDQGGSEVQPEAELGIEIEIAGQRGKRIEEAEHGLARAQSEVDNFERLLRGRVKEAFYNSLYLRRRLELFNKTAELNSRLRKATTVRFRSGEVAKLDENLAVIRDGRSRRDVFQADASYKNSLLELERLLGREPLGTLEPQGALQVQPASFDPAALIAAALEERPDLLASQAEIRRVEAEQQLTRRSVVPNLTLGAFYEEEVEAGGDRDRIIGGSVSFPLPVFDRKQGDLSVLNGRHAQAEYDHRAATLAIRSEVGDAHRTYDAAMNVLSLYETEALSRIGENFRFIETAYREGKIDLLELVVVQNDLVDAEFSYIESLWDYWRAVVALERAVARPLSQLGGTPKTN
jgi:cobalt-zinc-cadmium efflux system outer membrane protein